MADRALALKRELVDAACGLVAERLPDGEAEMAARFVETYYRGVPGEDLAGREPLDLYGAALAHLRFAACRAPGVPAIRVYNPTIERHGWQSTHTVVELVNDDMPFLVDSVSLELVRHGLGIHLLIHPVVVVRRDPGGRLVDVLDGALEAEGIAESFMHVEIDRQSDPARLAGLAADLERVLGDVRRAVADWRAMRAKVAAAKAEVVPPSDVVDAAELAEIHDFLDWLADDHFTFLGYAAYELVEGADGPELVQEAGSALGILAAAAEAQPSRSFQHLSRAAREAARSPAEPLLVTKSNSKSTVHRVAYLDIVGTKRYRDGQVIGAHRFLGLFTSSAHILSPRQIPLLRRKVQQVVERAGFRVGGHAYKALVHILETFPRDELFQARTDELSAIATGILHVQDRQRLRLFLRVDPFERFVSCLVYVPRDRYNTGLRERFQEILVREIGGSEAEFQALLGEEILARILFTVRTPAGAPSGLDTAELERKLQEASLTWTDRLRSALGEALGEERGNRLFERYAQAIPVSYQLRLPARAAVPDLVALDQLTEAGAPPLILRLYRRLEDEQRQVRLRIFRADDELLLSDVLPILEGLGLKVLSEEPFDFATGERQFAIHDFLLQPLDDQPVDVDRLGPIFQEAFLAVWTGAAENDGFNRLVLAAGLDMRRVRTLRAYCKYLLQLGVPFSQAYIERTFLANAALAAELARLFDARFDPALADREAQLRSAEAAIEAGLEEVASLDHDRILRAYLGMIRATLRTNAYRRDAAGRPRSYLSLKFQPAQVPYMPLPRPAFEIFVYAPEVEGVHLRGGKVARGGLRWSDRPEDFRTEILGLMKAQMVKNAVIVPVGAKGGFVLKRPPAGGDRAALQEDAVRCYKTFLRGLLDVTDNRSADGVVPPPDVVRWDEDDPYLVVAADKGTATFSDHANAVSREYGFWLDDAFASGGSAGYDHKAMGITARGAWESVKRHFRELGRDPQTEPFTVVGIGDMSGDVFGNGMLLSDRIRLIAAFDHRHIFLDPDPDPATSFAERQRLFALPRSSWADYDAALISPGGGIFARTLKSVALTPEVRAALDTTAEKLTPAELISAILRAPVDLLWNGGIGTYVKAAAESHADAQDRANDILRVDGESLRCKVVGEGGNLGFTQRGRIAYALGGGRINTDFIDNSAGVDCSDHEVNIKILLGEIVAAGDLTLKQRNELLVAMTEEVGELVLRDNTLQNLALSIGQALGPELIDAELRLMRKLERRELLHRQIEFLPDDAALLERRRAGRGLSRPELAVLLAYAKMALYEDLLAGELPDRAYFVNDLVKYFPRPLRRRFRAQIERHRLRRELIATWIANSLVNRGLHVFVSQLEDQTGAGLDDIVLGYVVARDAFRLLPLWNAVEALPASVDPAMQLELLVRLREASIAGTRWFVAHGGRPLGIRDLVGRYRPALTHIDEALDELLPARRRDALQEERRRLEAAGVEPGVARRLAALPLQVQASDIVAAASAAGQGEGERLSGAARVYFALEEALDLGWLAARIDGAAVRSGWDRLALNGLGDQLASALRRLTVVTLARLPGDGSTAAVGAAVGRLLAEAAYGVERYDALIAELREAEAVDLAPLTVAVRTLEGIGLRA
jgi:glutamate dehydrogenase